MVVHALYLLKDKWCQCRSVLHRGKADETAKANGVVGLDGGGLQNGVDKVTDEGFQPSVGQAEKLEKLK